jgi:diguanylate cyclase (GGDEF)-like protein
VRKRSRVVSGWREQARMEIDKTRRPERTQRAAGGYAKRSAADAVVAPEPGAVSASVLGIPETEFTPRVRDAIMTLMHEVGRLRREVEQVRAHMEDMARRADQDMLLPILNRRAFVREITRFTAFAERYRTPSSLIYIDLDGFKQVNDDHGHDAGDFALRHVCDLILGQIRESDVFARLGGDEFGVILTHVTADQAARKAAALAQSLRDRPPVVNGHDVRLSLSYGVYELRAGEAPDAAIREADRAMYAQKKSQS